MRSAVDPPKSSSVIHERSNKPLHSPENHTKILARFCRKFERVNSVSTRNRKKVSLGQTATLETRGQSTVPLDTFVVIVRLVSPVIVL